MTMKTTMMMMMMIVVTVAQLKGSSSSFPVLVMGDWGFVVLSLSHSLSLSPITNDIQTRRGQRSPPYTTKEELETAKGMANFAKMKGVDVTLALGDNFYDRGVTSVDDSRFQSTFENVFDENVLKDFRVLAGNHDHNGNVR